MKTLIAFIMILYTFLLMYWMFVGFGRVHYAGGEYRYNLIPFQTIKMYFQYWDKFNWRNWAVNVIGNVVVFAPFGMTVPYLFRWTFFRFLMRFVLVLFLLELLQLALQRGSFDVDDVLLNSTGAALGFLVFSVAKKFRR